MATNTENILKINDLHVTVEDKHVLNGISLTVNPGQVHAIMGPNGSGKSSLAYTTMGHPRYEITGGQITFNNELLNELSPDKRAKLGLFLAMQHPHEIDGIPYKDFLRQAYNALYDGTDKQLRIKEFNLMLLEQLTLLKMDPEFANRSVNVGFSGGEKSVLKFCSLLF
jgi:Fe-S cluster assembly ATP-binding protein